MLFQRIVAIAALLFLMLMPQPLRAQSDALAARLAEGAEHLKEGRNEQALQVLADAIQFAVTSDGEGSRGHGMALLNHSVALFTLGQANAAEREAKAALAILERKLDPDDMQLASALMTLMGIYASQGRVADGDKLLRRVIPIFEKNFGVDFPAIKAHLDKINWRGFLTVELDTSPFRPPKESARVSLRYIEEKLMLKAS